MADSKIKVTLNGQDDASGPLSKGLSTITGAAETAATAIKAMFAALVIDKIGEFFSSAVGAAENATKSIVQVGNALKNIGVDAASVQPQMTEFLRKVSDVSGVKLEDVQNAFTTLIRRTGDYNQAQALLLPTLDVAAAKNLDVASAANLVARAHDGNAKALKQVMNTQGAAADQNDGYIRTLNQIRNAWQDVLIQLGQAITAGDGVSTTGNKVVDTLRDMAEWFNRNHDVIAMWRDGIITVLTVVGKAFEFLWLGFNVVATGIADGLYIVTNATVAMGEGIALAVTGHFADAKTVIESSLSDIKEFVKNNADDLGKLSDALFPTDAQKLQHAASLQITAIRNYSTALIELHKTVKDYKGLTPTQLLGMKPEDIDKATYKVKDQVIPDGKIIGDGKEKKSVDELIKSLGDKADYYKELEKLNKTNETDLIAMIALDNKYTATLDKQNLSAKERLELLTKQHELESTIALTKARQGNASQQASTSLTPSVTGEAGALPYVLNAASMKGIGPDGLTDSDRKKATESNKKFAETQKEQLQGIRDAAIQVSQDIMGAFQAIASGGNVFKSFADAGKKAIADIAGQFAKFEIAQGVKGLAEGTWPPTPEAIAAAELHFASAALFGAIGGLVSGVGGGGGSGGGPASQASQTNNANALNNGTTGTIIIQGGILDMSDPRQAGALTSAINTLTGTRQITLSTG